MVRRDARRGSLLQRYDGRSPWGTDPSLTQDTDRCFSAALAAQVALARLTQRGADFCCSYSAAAAHLLHSQVAIHSRVFVSSKVSVIPSFSDNCIKIWVVQPMNARSRRKIPKRQWPPAEGAVSLSKTTLLLARHCSSCRAHSRPRAAVCRRARCPRPRVPARPPRILWLQLPSVRHWSRGYCRRWRGALRLSARPQPALRWRLAAAHAGRPAPPTPPVGAPGHGRQPPRATTASLCTPPAGDVFSCFVFLDPRACVATGWDLPGNTMDYVVEENKTLPNGEKKPLCNQKCCSRQHTGPAARRGRSIRAPSGRHGAARVR